MTLKEATADLHREAESLPLIRSIFEGRVNKQSYADYLYQLHLIYVTIEDIADELGVLRGIEAIKRSYLVRQDIAELLGYNKSNQFIRKPTLEYHDYLKSIHNDPDKILAHMYVRHMGDMYGGQMLKKVTPGAGNMYDFDDLDTLKIEFRRKLTDDMGDEARVAFQHNINIIKEYDDLGSG
jgi:heme oxygenase (biliverdin-producing, ferredoxin)